MMNQRLQVFENFKLQIVMLWPKSPQAKMSLRAPVDAILVQIKTNLSTTKKISQISIKMTNLSARTPLAKIALGIKMLVDNMLPTKASESFQMKHNINVKKQRKAYLVQILIFFRKAYLNKQILIRIIQASWPKKIQSKPPLTPIRAKSNMKYVSKSHLQTYKVPKKKYNKYKEITVKTNNLIQ